MRKYEHIGVENEMSKSDSQVLDKAPASLTCTLVIKAGDSSCFIINSM